MGIVNSCFVNRKILPTIDHHDFSAEGANAFDPLSHDDIDKSGETDLRNSVSNIIDERPHGYDDNLQYSRQGSRKLRELTNYNVEDAFLPLREHCRRNQMLPSED